MPQVKLLSIYCSMQIESLGRNSINVSMFRNIYQEPNQMGQKWKKCSGECNYILEPMLKWSGKFFIPWHWETGFSPKNLDVFPLSNVNHFSSASLHDDWKRSNLTPVTFLLLEEVFLKSCLGELAHWQTLTSLRGEGEKREGEKQGVMGGRPWFNKPLKTVPLSTT